MSVFALFEMYFFAFYLAHENKRGRKPFHVKIHWFTNFSKICKAKGDGEQLGQKNFGDLIFIYSSILV